MSEALQLLIELLDDGYEFPDAQWEVTRRLKLSDKAVTNLVKEYADHCD